MSNNKSVADFCLMFDGYQFNRKMCFCVFMRYYSCRMFTMWHSDASHDC